MLLRPHVDEVLEAGELLAFEVPALLLERLGHQIADDLDVVDVAVRVDDAQRLHVGLFEHVVELVALVDGFTVTMTTPIFRGVHEGEPVGDVARPYAQVVAGLHADGEQALGEVVGALVKLGVSPAQIAVGINDELMIGIDGNLIAEVIADGLLGVQRIVPAPRDGLVFGRS